MFPAMARKYPFNVLPPCVRVANTGVNVRICRTIVREMSRMGADQGMQSARAQKKEQPRLAASISRSVGGRLVRRNSHAARDSENDSSSLFWSHHPRLDVTKVSWETTACGRQPCS